MYEALQVITSIKLLLLFILGYKPRAWKPSQKNGHIPQFIWVCSRETGGLSFSSSHEYFKWLKDYLSNYHLSVYLPIYLSIYLNCLWKHLDKWILTTLHRNIVYQRSRTSVGWWVTDSVRSITIISHNGNELNIVPLLQVDFLNGLKYWGKKFLE